MKAVRTSGLGRSAGRERQAAIVAGALGLVVAIGLAPLRYDLKTFAWNFGWQVLPPALGAGALLLLRARPAVVAGATLAWTAYLVAFWWIAQAQPPRTLFWLWYPVALPGGVAGSIAAWWVSRRRSSLSGVGAGAFAAAIVAAGLALGAWIPWVIFFRA